MSAAAAILAIGLTPSSRPVASVSARTTVSGPVAQGRSAGNGSRSGSDAFGSLSTWLLLPRQTTQDTLPEDLQRIRRRAVLPSRSGRKRSMAREGQP